MNQASDIERPATLAVAPFEGIQANLQSIERRIEDASNRAGRNAGDVRLVAVTKSVGIVGAEALRALGVKHLGENRVESATEKIRSLNPKPVWHMIGNIQRRKVKDIVPLFDRIDAVDRLSLAEEIEKRCADENKVMPILVEVNVSGETAKHGFAPTELKSALEGLNKLEHLKVEGLMTMAPNTSDPEETRPVFAALRELAECYGLPTRSMGMTNDFEVAIEEGATEVRIGSALFKGVSFEGVSP